MLKFKKAKKKAKPEAKKVEVSKAPDEFSKALRGLRARVVDMQLRPGETKSLNEALDRLEELR